MMKWHEVARWVCCSHGEIIGGKPASAARLRLLEEISTDCKSLEEWKSKVKEELQLEKNEKTSWTADKRLMEFFQESSLEKNKRLSEGAGKGLW